MREELQHPLMTDMVEEALDISIEHPVHTLLLQPRVERIERLVRVSSWPEPIRKALEVRLVDLIEDGHHGLLNNLVLQRRDAQRSLPSVGLWNIHSPRRLCPVRATVDPVVQIGNRPSNPVSYSRHVTPSTPGAAFFFNASKLSRSRLSVT